jgi:hypothetical protein
LPIEAGRAKGFGYAEFEDRQSLLDALALNESVCVPVLKHNLLLFYIMVMLEESPCKSNCNSLSFV